MPKKLLSNKENILSYKATSKHMNENHLKNKSNNAVFKCANIVENNNEKNSHTKNEKRKPFGLLSNNKDLTTDNARSSHSNVSSLPFFSKNVDVPKVPLCEQEQFLSIQNLITESSVASHLYPQQKCSTISSSAALHPSTTSWETSNGVTLKSIENFSQILSENCQEENESFESFDETEENCLDLEVSMNSIVESYSYNSFCCSFNKEKESKVDLVLDVPEYVNDILKYLKTQENLHRPRWDYMVKQPDITHQMRSIVVDWLVEVCEEYKMTTESLHLSVQYMDKFLSTMAVSRNKLQLLATTSLFISSKFEEIYPPDISEFVYITDGSYTKEEVIRMEQIILKCLEFNLSPPTSYYFTCKFCRRLNMTDCATSLALYLTDLTLIDGNQYLKYKPSIVACSAILLCNVIMGEDPWNDFIEEFSGYIIQDFSECAIKIYKTHLEAPCSELKAIHNKYAKSKYKNVAMMNYPPSASLLFVKDDTETSNKLMLHQPS